jgi:hypothetical protein
MKIEKLCKQCNLSFTAYRKDNVFCSKICKNTYCNSTWRLKNKDKVSFYSKNYQQLNATKLKEQHQEYRLQNIEAIKQKKQQWQKDFKQKHGISYAAHRRQNSLNERIKHNIRVRINKAIKGINKTGSAVDELGCSLGEFQLFIQNKFTLGMTWDNYGEWEIDHIIPLDSFDLSDAEQFKVACHHSNLQPLWKSVNRIKSSKVC